MILNKDIEEAVNTLKLLGYDVAESCQGYRVNDRLANPKIRFVSNDVIKHHGIPENWECDDSYEITYRIKHDKPFMLDIRIAIENLYDWIGNIQSLRCNYAY